jgi:riboflavin synthase
MFTGIITGVGRIAAVHDLSSADRCQPSAAGSAYGKRLTVEAPMGYLDEVGLGDSIALNGACMTVTALEADQRRFTIEISAESLARTAGLSEPGPINLEKALRANDRLGGHMVSGHVDGVGEVTRFAPVGESREMRIMVPAALGKFLAYKGSIAVNGVSLTVNTVTDSARGTEVSINLIPHTISSTALGSLRDGSRVNLEIDLIARYVERMLTAPAQPQKASE